MIYMLIFWMIVAASAVYYYLSKRGPEAIDRLMLGTFLAFAFLTVAIITKDPLFSSFGVPMEFEWIVGLFIACLSSWKLYFAPLKDRAVNTEKEVIYMKSDISSIKADVHLIKEKLIH
ncbi:MAG TPA: hypothetical protein VJI46_01910 [Candidatus Nanoarchaeia archaeon]|nr:hypothetical protein [Candidatus Nanoarchaeia archaeon]